MILFDGNLLLLLLLPVQYHYLLTCLLLYFSAFCLFRRQSDGRGCSVREQLAASILLLTFLGYCSDLYHASGLNVR